MSERTYTVQGMTCSHCVTAVREGVAGIDGVEDVDVSLSDGRVVVRGEGFRDEQVAAAVDEAGYEVVG